LNIKNGYLILTDNDTKHAMLLIKQNYLLVYILINYLMQGSKNQVTNLYELKITDITSIEIFADVIQMIFYDGDIVLTPLTRLMEIINVVIIWG